MSQAAGTDKPAVTRSDTRSSDEAIPDEDLSGTTRLLLERLRAWKHAVGYLENYVSATEKIEKNHAKEYEKVLKTIADPLREGQHFDQSQGGICGLLENMRLNTQGIVNVHLETEKNLRTSVLPVLHRLHDEIKANEKDVVGSAAKGSKSVDRARTHTQHHIELLGQHSAGSSSSPSTTSHKPDPSTDPYVVQRGLYHRLNKQILEENSSRQEILAVQDQFAQFESHVIQTIQQALSTFTQFVCGQAERQKALYADIISTGQRVPLDFEWKSFLHRNDNVLMDPSAPPRSIENVSFPNQNHPSTKPLIEGLLERKSRLLVKSYSSGYYVVTPAKYLHEYKDTDNYKKDPSPELSLYLPDCTVSVAPDGPKFSVRGKDASKGRMGVKIGTTHDLAFKAHSPEDAVRWCEVIRTVAGGTSSGTEPSSPVEERKQPQVQTQGIVRTDSAAKTPVTPGSAEKAHTPVEGKEEGGEAPALPIRDGAAPAAPAAPAAAASPTTGQVSGVTKAPGDY